MAYVADGGLSSTSGSVETGETEKMRFSLAIKSVLPAELAAVATSDAKAVPDLHNSSPFGRRCSLSVSVSDGKGGGGLEGSGGAARAALAAETGTALLCCNCCWTGDRSCG